MQAHARQPQPSTSRTFRAEHEWLTHLLLEVEEAWNCGNSHFALSLLYQFEERRERHFFVEEHFLFPSVARHSQGGSVLVRSLLNEHAKLTRLTEALIRLFEADVAEGTRELQLLMALLEQHETREDRLLFPACDRILDPELRARAARALDRKIMGPTQV